VIKLNKKCLYYFHSGFLTIPHAKIVYKDTYINNHVIKMI